MRCIGGIHPTVFGTLDEHAVLVPVRRAIAYLVMPGTNFVRRVEEAGEMAELHDSFRSIGLILPFRTRASETPVISFLAFWRGSGLALALVSKSNWQEGKFACLIRRTVELNTIGKMPPIRWHQLYSLAPGRSLALRLRSE